MPIYEYRCNACQQVNEFLVLGKEERLSCSACGSEDLVRVMSAHNTQASTRTASVQPPVGSCCGSPGSCGSPGGCCGGA